MSAQLFQNPRPDFERDLLTQLAARWGRRAVTLGVLGYLTPGQPGSPPRQDPVIEPHRLLCLLQLPDRITRCH
jgi:hypothetical protein